MNHVRTGKKRSFSRSKKRSKSTTERSYTETRPEIQASVRKKLDQGTYIVFDIETTGGNPERNGITDIYAIKWKNGTIVETFGTLVNPQIPIPPIVRRMTGITNSMVRHAPLIDEVMPDFVDFVEDGILVSHNTIGDMKFIRYFAEKSTGKTFDNFFLCTHLLVEKLFPETPDKSLSGLAQYFKIESGDLHRAEADAYATLELFKVLIQRIEQKKFEYIDETIRFQGDMESGLRLGWAVPTQTIESLPQTPGVFTLIDSENKAMLVSSAFNIQKDVLRLRTSTQLPRQILKMVLRTYQITYESTATLYQAMLRESEISNEKNAGTNLHQRIVTAFTIHQNKGLYRLSVDTISSGVISAYGPVRDKRAAMDLIQRLAEVLGKNPKTLYKSGLECDHHEIRLIRALLGKELGEFKNLVDKETRSLPLLFQPTKKRRLRSLLSLADTLHSMELPARTQDLLSQKGLLAIKNGNKNDFFWDIYHIDHSRPVRTIAYEGKIEDFPKSPLAHQLIFGGTMKINHKKRLLPLDPVEARLTNATLWWLLNGRGDARFFLWEELKTKLRQNEVGTLKT